MELLRVCKKGADESNDPELFDRQIGKYRKLADSNDIKSDIREAVRQSVDREEFFSSTTLSEEEALKVARDYDKTVEAIKLPKFFKRSVLRIHCGKRMIRVVLLRKSNSHRPFHASNKFRSSVYVCSESRCRSVDIGVWMMGG